MALVAYLDLVILSVPWGWLVLAAGQYRPDASTPAWVALLAYAGVELALFRIVAWSPGLALLGMRLVDVRAQGGGIDRIWQGHLPYVARAVKERESWFTLALGTWILNDASKSFIRWAMWTPPIPVFGHETDHVSGALVSIGSGALEALIAVALFRMNIRAVMIGIPYYGVQLASAVTSWTLWAAWAGEMVVRRRAYQGLSLRTGEVEQARDTGAMIAVGGVIVMIALLAAAIPRLRRRRAADGNSRSDATGHETT
jgi:hypothetical protein